MTQKVGPIGKKSTSNKGRRILFARFRLRQFPGGVNEFKSLEHRTIETNGTASLIEWLLNCANQQLSLGSPRRRDDL
jgi:hypothetical protein